MQLHIDTADPRPVHEQIVDEVRRALVLGSIRAGDALPSVRELAAELRVNPGVVARAFREMERAGLVAVRWGGGTFAAGPGDTGAGREMLARGVAERALRDARHHGVGVDDLVEQIRRAAASVPPPHHEAP
jgi:GntR family transcriptional regulator